MGNPRDRSLETSFRDPPMSHSQSKTWSSSQQQERQKFSRAQNLLRHFVPDSPFCPKNAQEWIAHRAAMQAMEMKSMSRKIEHKKMMKDKAIVPVRNSIFIRRDESGSNLSLRISFSPGGQQNHFLCMDDKSSVLARPSIWLPYIRPTPGHPIAPWPDIEELRYEGDDRAKSGVGRYLPLPRRPGNETVTWKERQQTPFASELDLVGPIKFCPYEFTWAPIYSPLGGSSGIPYHEDFGIIDTGEGWLDPLLSELWREL